MRVPFQAGATPSSWQRCLQGGLGVQGILPLSSKALQAFYPIVRIKCDHMIRPVAGGPDANLAQGRVARIGHSAPHPCKDMIRANDLYQMLVTIQLEGCPRGYIGRSNLGKRKRCTGKGDCQKWT